MKKNIATWIALITLTALSFGQGFTDINAGLTGLHFSDVAWGDYDGDGDLDLLIAGLNSSDIGVTKLYRNDGNEEFNEVAGLPFPGTFVGDFCWGDYDNDGDLDLLLQGYTTSSQITEIYRNEGNDSFVESDVILPALADGSVSFTDLNNDGWLDLLIAGFDGAANQAYLYRNNGDGSFDVLEQLLPGAIKSCYEWGDFDNDSHLDLFITGLDATGSLISVLYKNNGNDTFTETGNEFTGAWLGDAAWGDYDSDGDLDLLLCGFTFPNDRIAELYLNDGEGNFTLFGAAGLTGVSHASTIWGDYDNDGDLDVFIGGTYEDGGGWVRVIDVFLNSGLGFTAAGLEFAHEVIWGESAWGDFDGDRDLDLVCCGYDDAGNSYTTIYRNDAPVANTPPTPPTGLEAWGADDEYAELSWEEASDSETAAAGLTYNVYVRNEYDEIVWGSMSNMANGQRLLPAWGNAQQNRLWIITGLECGDYTWSVQAIDNNFAGSQFAEEGTFSVGCINVDPLEPAEFQLLSNYPNPFNGVTTFRYQLQQPGLVKLELFDIEGRLVQLLVDRQQQNGCHEATWNGKSVSGEAAGSGLYLYRLQLDGNEILNGKCLLVK